MTASTLRRKLLRKVTEPAPPDAPDAQDRALAQVLGQGLGLALSDMTSRQGTAGAAEVLELVDPEGLALLVTQADGRVGVIALSRAGALALSEVSTLGTPAPRPPASRPPTAVDSLLIEPLLQKFLRLSSVVEGEVTLRMIEDHRLLGVALEEGAFHLYRCEGGMSRDGRMREVALLLALPLAPPPPPPAVAPAEPVLDWDDQLQRAVLSAPADLRAVLAVLHKPLSEVMEMGVGTRIDLPLSLLEEVRLESLDRTLCATGRLGQARGMRALRLTSLPAPEDEPAP